MAQALDRAAGLTACAGDPDLHRQLASLLAGELPQRLGQLAEALTGGDLMAAARHAHKHKGACLAVGALALAERLTRVDAAGRRGDAEAMRHEAAGLPADAEAFRHAVAELRARAIRT